MEQAKNENFTSLDRLELLWLLLKKRKVDFTPQQVTDSEVTTNIIARESEEKLLEKHSEVPASDE